MEAKPVFTAELKISDKKKRDIIKRSKKDIEEFDLYDLVEIYDVTHKECINGAVKQYYSKNSYLSFECKKCGSYRCISMKDDNNRIALARFLYTDEKQISFLGSQESYGSPNDDLPVNLIKI